MDDRDERLLAVIRLVGAGEVVSYGDVAEDAGLPRHARRVGALLAEATQPLPWWRVVNAAGRLVPGHEVEQAGRLWAEGVTIVGDRVTRSPYGRFAKP